MKKVEITVKKSDVYADVGLTTSYTGAKGPAGSDGMPTAADYQRVATREEDERLLTHYWTDAASELTERLKGFVTEADFTGDALRLGLEVSGGYDEGMTPVVEASVRSYMSSAVSASWFRIADPGKAGEYERDAARFLTQAERQLYHRKAPSRRGK